MGTKEGENLEVVAESGGGMRGGEEDRAGAEDKGGWWDSSHRVLLASMGHLLVRVIK